MKMPVFRIEKTKDYTVMSNHHLRDTDYRLSCYAASDSTSLVSAA